MIPEADHGAMDTDVVHHIRESSAPRWILRALVRTTVCHRCGGRLYRTLRAADYQPLLTCFSCGTETTTPVRPKRAPAGTV